VNRQWFVINRRPIIFAAVALLHLLVLVFFRFSLPDSAVKPAAENYEILKLVDVQEALPPPPDVKAVTVYRQPVAAEKIVESAAPVVESKNAASETGVAEPDYLPQFKVSSVPEIPTREILSRIEYPPIALRQGIEGVVYLELFIDQTGTIRKINVLKDPGYGFAAAAVASLQGIHCTPAIANGTPVAVRFRYPVRFTLNN
jgi:protein TonB